jgi:hypothetical protein
LAMGFTAVHLVRSNFLGLNRFMMSFSSNSYKAVHENSCPWIRSNPEEGVNIALDWVVWAGHF